MRSILLVALLALLSAPAAARAQAPFQLAFFPPAQLVPEDQAVSGVRLSLYGRNAAMSGFDLGVVTHTTGNASALQVAAVNLVEGDFLGAQLGWGLGGALANITRGHMQGAQVGLYNGAGTGEGVQFGFINHTEGRMQGFQLSFVNIADDMYGLQVGLVNIIRSKERFPVLPLVNWKFD